jgi:hypothetical protein
VDIESVCGSVLQNNFASGKKQMDLVPELSGSEETLRERYEVSYADQPYLYVPLSVVPEAYYLRDAKFNLLNINDNLLSATTLNPLIANMTFNPSSPVLSVMSKAAGTMDQLSPPITVSQKNYMFEGLGYNQNLIKNYLDSLYSGKVEAWNENGNKVESCEEYAYEKFYDFSLYKDFSSLHIDDPLRVVEYAYRGSILDNMGIHINEDSLPTGAIGSKFMGCFALHAIPTGLSDVIQRKGGMPRSIFDEMKIYYSKMSNTSYFYETNSPDIDVEVYWNHVFSKNQIRLTCGYPSPECIQTPVVNLMPKNFFMEVMGHINKDNDTRTSGIVLSSQELRDVFSVSGFESAIECYDNSFIFHFLMLKAAKRLYPDSSVLKRKLLEFKLLRKHLIQLLAERAKWETRLTPMSKKFSESILTTSETLPPSEKDYASMKLYENITKPLVINMKQAKSRVRPRNPFDITVIDPGDIISVNNELKKIDDQIEAVLLDAKARGCLDISIWGADNHNYPVNATTNDYDLLYDKALCDWSPEMFTTAAVTLIPDSYYENVYSDCMRVTGGKNFDEGTVDNFKFLFPSQCENIGLFKAWSPNKNVDYTDNTVRFNEFEQLVKMYPEALMDCDDIIAQRTKKDLEEADMNYFDPVTGKVMMSKSRSYYDSVGGEYAGLYFGYALGWLYEGYDNIAEIMTLNQANRDFVCGKTGFFAFGNYFAGGSFLGRDFTLCSAGSYASNKTSGASRPVPPTLDKQENENRINSDINAVASESGVNTTYFMFVKNEKMTFSYDNEIGRASCRERVS